VTNFLLPNVSLVKTKPGVARKCERSATAKVPILHKPHKKTKVCSRSKLCAMCGSKWVVT